MSQAPAIAEQTSVARLVDRAAKALAGAVTAAQVLDARYQEAAGAEFWSGFSRNDGLRRGDPRHTLLNDLMTRTKRHTLMAQSMIVPAVAWNAYFRNRPLSQIKVTETTRFELLGTPFTIAARQ